MQPHRNEVSANIPDVLDIEGAGIDNLDVHMLPAD
jgi:hypothetical protein